MKSCLRILRAQWTLKRHADRRSRTGGETIHRRADVPVGSARLPALLIVPPRASGFVLWPQATIESHREIAGAWLNRAGLATLAVELPSPDGTALDPAVERLLAAARWLVDQPETARFRPAGLLGVNGLAPAVLAAAAELGRGVSGVVAAGGRYDLLDAPQMARLRAPTRLVALRSDEAGLSSARQVQPWLGGPNDLVLVPGAPDIWTPDAQWALAALTGEWLLRWLAADERSRHASPAGRAALAWRLGEPR